MGNVKGTSEKVKGFRTIHSCSLYSMGKVKGTHKKYEFQKIHVTYAL